MPIVDDPFTFGMISGCNALSDIYAMGGKPVMAIAIFGWPIDKLSAEIGAKVIEGGRAACAKASISLAGGHSIDSPEPIFGLSVSGVVKIEHLKRNTCAQIGDSIFLTKPLGVGILSTAQKQKKVTPRDYQEAVEQMCQLNDIGSKIAKIKGVNAITDVTGFGLAGHLLEVCQGSNVGAKVYFNDLPLLSNIYSYIDKGCIPGGTQRNHDSYGHYFNKLTKLQTSVLCDPQTSGGLLITVSDESLTDFHELLSSHQLNLRSIGKITELNLEKELVYIE
jgi:selenide,water dikinase